MTKEEFIKLFELEIIYEKYQNKTPFGFGLFDHIIGSNNFIIYNFYHDRVKINIECVEFNNKAQHFEINIIFNDNQIDIQNSQPKTNEIFPFLTFDTHFDEALKFIADFLNKILKPKYQLIGKIFIN